LADLERASRYPTIHIRVAKGHVQNVNLLTIAARPVRRNGWSLARPATNLQIRLEEKSMPNQKSRRKKDGANKTKKLQAMRAKETAAKPTIGRTATGKLSGRDSKFERTRDRPGALNRA
jgi:hypothetical protein